MKYCSLIAVILLLANCKQENTKKYMVTKEFALSSNDIHVLQGSGWEQPIKSVGGDIYIVYLNPDLYPVVVKKDKSGKIKSHIVEEFAIRHDLHHTFSLGIDAKGFIHILGNQHNLPSNEQLEDPHKGNLWRYWVSRKPNDITEWEFIADSSKSSIPVAMSAYPKFFNSPKGDLYATFRGYSGYGGYGSGSAGKYGAYVAKYGVEEKKWELLGADKDSLNTMWAYEFAGSNGTHYQPIRPQMCFSESGRIHVATPINSDNSAWPGSKTHQNGFRSATAVLYGYSDNKGKTWHKASSEKINLPTNVKSGDTIDFITPGQISNCLTIGQNQGNPFVKYQRSSENIWKFWDEEKNSWGDEWTETANTSNIHCTSSGKFLGFDKGEIYELDFLEDSLKINPKSIDLRLKGDKGKFDITYTEPNRARIITYSKDSVRVYTIKFYK